MSEPIAGALWLSLRVSLLATALNAVIGLPVAYLLAKRRFWGRTALDVLVTLPLVLPPTVTGYYLIVLFGRRGWVGRPLYELTGWTIAFTWYSPVKPGVRPAKRTCASLPSIVTATGNAARRSGSPGTCAPAAISGVTGPNPSQ